MTKLKGYIDRLKVVSDEHNKSLIWLLFHMLYWYVVIGAPLTDYLNYQFYLKKSKDIRKYAVVRTQGKFYEKINPTKYKTFFTVKPNFLNNFKEYVGREWYVPEEGKTKLKKFLSNKKEIIVKPIDGLGGYGVKKLKVKDLNINDFYEELLNNRLFIEEVIVQHSKINKICKTSVNTIRIMTLVHNDEVEILYTAMRIGNGNFEVDNFHKGGMGVLVNKKTGKLIGNAIDKELNEFKVHPASKSKFNGFQLPFWNETIELVKNAALVNTNIKLVGWDVAITEKGPIFVEGNRRPGFDLIQVLDKRGRKDILEYVENKIKK